MLPLFLLIMTISKRLFIAALSASLLVGCGSSGGSSNETMKHNPGSQGDGPDDSLMGDILGFNYSLNESGASIFDGNPELRPADAALEFTAPELGEVTVVYSNPTGFHGAYYHDDQATRITSDVNLDVEYYPEGNPQAWLSIGTYSDHIIVDERGIGFLSLEKTAVNSDGSFGLPPGRIQFSGSDLVVEGGSGIDGQLSGQKSFERGQYPARAAGEIHLTGTDDGEEFTFTGVFVTDESFID